MADLFHLEIVSPIDVRLRVPNPGNVEIMEVRFRTGLVTAELDSQGACRLVLPPNALRLSLDLNCWRGFEASLRRGTPDGSSLARALQDTGASQAVVDYLCQTLPNRNRAGRPVKLDPCEQWLRAWTMNVEVVYLQLKGSSRKAACQKVAQWHGLKQSTVHQTVPATGEYAKFARIKHILP
jgi:hypothetical protein